MSDLSGYDSDVVGFDSVNQNKRAETSSSTQTYDYSETGAASQTNLLIDRGCMATPEDLNATESVLKEYPPPGLNEFLRKVVPSMMDQLNQNDKEFLYNSSDSEDEAVTVRLLQEIKVKSDTPAAGAGDQRASSILAVTWNSTGSSIAVSIGKSQHENWCEHDGLIKIYTLKRSEGEKYVHALDITEKNCVTAVQFHPSIGALLAYGTTSGEVVFCNLSNSADEGIQLTSPTDCHGSKRVSALLWADAQLANIFLIKQIAKTGKRRHTSDQVLISSGSDGAINIWQVNANFKIFTNITCFKINGSRKMAPPDITCFDFIKTYPLRPSAEKIPEDIFVVGTKSGTLYLCSAKNCRQIADGEATDPVYEMLDGHGTCLVDVEFSQQKVGSFISTSIDSEMRIYDINQQSPLKVLCLDVAISCVSWLPSSRCAVVGLSAVGKETVRLYDVASGRMVAVEGLNGGEECVTAVAVSRSGACRIAAGDFDGVLRVWELPSRRIRVIPDEF